MIRMLLGIYSLLIIVYAVVTWIRVPSNRWTEMLRSIVEPALKVTRDLLKRFVPFLANTGIDWSPVVLVIVLNVLRSVLTWIV
ncbi:MAG: YggT family protein [Clostridia bacterium]|nr:YggT family protein [Clostridia bacterium]